jgi:hypothetical protein
MPWYGINPEISEFLIDSQQFGKINVLKAGSDDWEKKAIFLHGCPSSG